VLLLNGHRAKPITSIAFSPDGTRLASTCADDAVLLWDLGSGQGKTVGRPYPGYAYSVAFHPQGNGLAWPNRGNVVEFLDLTAHGFRFIEVGGNGPYLRIAFTPDGRTLVVVGPNVRAWDMEGGRLLPAWEGNAQAEGHLACSPDGMKLATPHARPHGPTTVRRFDHEIKVWSLAEGRQWNVLRGHTDFVSDLAFAPNSRTLAAACGQSLWVWNTLTGNTLFRHRLDKRDFKGVAFSPDGRWLATAHKDHTVRFFDTRTWREHAAFDWEIGPVLHVAFAPDGMRAAAGSNKGKIIVWDVDL
jgi:WD40 repeat protein